MDWGKIIDYILKYNMLRTRKFWASYMGLVIVLIGMSLLLGSLSQWLISQNIITLKEDWVVCLISYLIIIFISICIWACWSKRIFIRDNFLTALLVIALSIGASYFLTSGIQNLLLRIWEYTLQPYIVIGLYCVFTILLLFLVLYCETKWLRKKKLLICIAINQVDYPSIDAVNNSLYAALNKIISQYDDIEFICLPYDLKKNIKRYAKYINRLWVQADALIYASVINDGNGKYSYSNFSSRLNTRRITTKSENEILNKILGVYEKEKNWNTLNAEENELTSRIQISENLFEMLLVYVTSVYLIKRNYAPAVNISREVYQIYANQYSSTATLTNRLFSYALLMNALSAESEHNYELAKERIDEYVECFPAMERTWIYQMTMARLHYYLGNIPASKRCTQSFKATNLWGYSLNMGFYAIIEGKVGEFISNYRRLLTKQRPQLSEVTFAIRFLDYERKNSNETKVELLLGVAISLLNLYIDYKRSKKMLPQFRKEHYGLSTIEMKNLTWAETCIIEAKENYLCLK